MRICVIPNKPIQVYIDQGFSEESLWQYFNPQNSFNEVYIASWQETKDWNYGNLNIVSLCLDKKSVKILQKGIKHLSKHKVLSETFTIGIFHKFQERIVSDFRSIDADIIRAYNGHWAAELGMELKGKLRSPFITSILDDLYIIPNALVFADSIICREETVRDYLKQRGIQDQKINCIPDYTDIMNFQTDQEKQDINKNVSDLYQSFTPEAKLGTGKVSIILPTFNGAEYIRKSIDSCLNQSYKNVELVIVNDGSTDGTADIVKSYKDPRIKYIEHEVNKRLPGALNTGFSNASGEYLSWTSDDNLYAPEAIETLIRLLNFYSDVDFVYADYYCINEKDEIVKTVKVKPADMIIYSASCIGACFLYRRRVYEKIGNYNTDSFLAEDYDYWLRVWKNNFNIQYLQKALYYYRIHGGSLTGKYESQISRKTNEIRKNILLTELYLDHKTRSRLHILIGFNEYEIGNMRQAKNNIIHGILYNPSCLKDRKVILMLILILVELLFGKSMKYKLLKLKRLVFGLS